MKKRTFILGTMIACLTATASAQTFEDYQRRHANLVAISSIFGELHHIRRHCNPRMEGDVWRERMKTLVELEEPQPAAREEMVSAFNESYRAAQRRYPSCTRQARDYAASSAQRGEIIIARLTAPLFESVREDNENSVFVFEPNETNQPQEN